LQRATAARGAAGAIQKSGRREVRRPPWIAAAIRLGRTGVATRLVLLFFLLGSLGAALRVALGVLLLGPLSALVLSARLALARLTRTLLARRALIGIISLSEISRLTHRDCSFGVRTVHGRPLHYRSARSEPTGLRA
jgi:hypothetical protein